MKYFTLIAAGTPEAAVVGTPVDNFSDYDAITVQVRVTAEEGTASMTVYIQGTYDGGTSWVDLAASPVITATGTYIIPVTRNGSASAPFAATDATMTAATTKTVVIPDKLRAQTAGTIDADNNFTYSVVGVAK